MKTLFIESRLKDLKLNLSKQEISRLPRKLFLAYSIQYKELANQVKSLLQSNKITIKGFQQVLGCSEINTNLPVLLIGSGRFHAMNLYSQSKEIFILENNKITKIPENEINSLKAKRKSALLKFLYSDSIGILVSTKQGQENMNLAIKLRKKLKAKGKSAFIFLSNNIDTSQFENFNIGSWVNTACPGIAYNNPAIINIRELPKDF